MSHDERIDLAEDLRTIQTVPYSCGPLLSLPPVDDDEEIDLGAPADPPPDEAPTAPLPQGD